MHLITVHGRSPESCAYGASETLYVAVVAGMGWTHMLHASHLFMHILQSLIELHFENTSSKLKWKRISRLGEQSIQPSARPL